MKSRNTLLNLDVSQGIVQMQSHFLPLPIFIPEESNVKNITHSLASHQTSKKKGKISKTQIKVTYT